MRHPKPILLLFLVPLLYAITAISCKHEGVTDPTDQQLLKMAHDTAGFTWYKRNDTLLTFSSIGSIPSGHSEPFRRTRFNGTAALQLDTTGKLFTTAHFADGSLIVKELWSDATTLTKYAIMYRRGTNPDADASGWVWNEVKPDGTVAYSASKKGADCRGCHSQAGNLDFSMMNAAYP